MENEGKKERKYIRAVKKGNKKTERQNVKFKREMNIGRKVHGKKLNIWDKKSKMRTTRKKKSRKEKCG